jgi:hypothetical protein
VRRHPASVITAVRERTIADSVFHSWLLQDEIFADEVLSLEVAIWDMAPATSG